MSAMKRLHEQRAPWQYRSSGMNPDAIWAIVDLLNILLGVLLVAMAASRVLLVIGGITIGMGLMGAATKLGNATRRSA